MLSNFLLTAYRSLLKKRFFTTLNILGLAVGMIVFLLIVQYVHFERSYEKFLPHPGDIYRVTLEMYKSNELLQASAENYPGVGPALKNEFPDVLGYARLYNMGYKNNVVIAYEDKAGDPIAFKQKRFLYADSSFLPMMGYEMAQGEARTALAQANSIVISERYATMYFGNEDPLGKVLHLRDDDYNSELCKVTGVFKDLPENTHIKFDVLISYKTLFSRGDWAITRYDQGWFRKDMYTFVQLREGTDVKAFEAKLPAIVDKYNPELKKRDQANILRLQPIESIHLNSNLAEEFETNGDERIVSFMGIIAIFVLILAWVNYINLSTAKALERANEVGVRKVMGAFKTQLMTQFFVEAALVNLISLVTAFVTVWLLLPAFNFVSGINLTGAFLFESWYLGLIALLWIGGTLLSGFYPALVLASFKPVSVLKGKLKNSKGGVVLRKSLVIGQFVISAALIASTLIVNRQLDFMMNQDIGMNIEQVLVLERPGSQTNEDEFPSKVEAFKNSFANSTSIKGITSSLTVPGKLREYKAAVKKYGADDTELVPMRFNSMDYEFIDVFGMKLLAGRNFSREFPKDQDTSVVVTQSLVKQLGFKSNDDILGQTLQIPNFGWSAIVVGVVNDYHQVSFKKTLDPTIFYCNLRFPEYFSVKISTADLPAALAEIERAWNTNFPGNPFEYFFLDEYFNQQYKNEQRFGRLFSIFSGLAIMIGCLGLLGLSAFTAAQRTKEIGIRKALGSSEQSIFILVSSDFIKLVLIAVLLSIAPTYYIMNTWMEGFAFKAGISWIVFVWAGFGVLSVSLLTVSFQILKAARTNPVSALRYE
jgi:putative ABC transport system permease protein